MPAGIEVWDQFGQQVVSITDRLSRFLGVLYIPEGTSGYIYHDGFLTGTPYYFSARANPNGQNFMNNTMIAPTISFSGGYMYYTAPAAPHRVIYGVY